MPRKPSSQRRPSHLETAFEELWGKVAAGTPLIATLDKEIALPPRRYKFDFRIPHTNVLIEIQGGTFSRVRMGHSTGEGLNRDYHKCNYCMYKGFQLFYFDRKMINLENVEALFLYVVRKYPELA